MEKAYDVKDLVEKAKAKGLDIAEDAAGHLVDILFDWLDESAQKSDNVYDDILRSVYPLAKAEAKKAVDKIDGKVDAPAGD